MAITVTDPSPDTPTRPAPRGGSAAPVRRPGPAAVLWGSIALFAALFAFLTYRMETGHDPLLGAAGSGAASSRPVLVRQVVKRRIVTTVLPGPGGSSVSASGGSAGVSSFAAPIVTGAS